MSGFNTYDECVEWSKECIGSQEIWIFEDQDGVFHPISLVYGQKTFKHYVHTVKWIPRGRVFTEFQVVTMWTGGAIPDERTN
jgi:hypothetical protein